MRQMRVLAWWRIDGLARSVSGLAEDANVSPAVVRGLITCGRAGHRPRCRNSQPSRRPIPISRPPNLNDDQVNAAAYLRDMVLAEKFSAHPAGWRHRLGQTEVYFEAVAEALAQGRQVLILLPEIALTVQFLDASPPASGCGPPNGTAICPRKSAAAPIAR